MTLAEYQQQLQIPLRQTTLCFLIKDQEVLLAMKKRGFGQGKWNGVGGKCLPGESVEQAAQRELQEEIGVTAGTLQRAATIRFYYPFDPTSDQEVHVYLVTWWSGEPVETEEMRPQWFAKTALPYTQMWPDDTYWLPEVLSGNSVEAAFLFTADLQIKDYSLKKKKRLI